MMQTFLMNFNRINHSKVRFDQGMDWDIINALLYFRLVPLFQYSSNLISQAVFAQRVDVLCNISEYCNDLTEKQAVDILIFVGSVDLSVLVS